MPLWYPSGAVAEHQINITNAGIFDTSHMSVVTIEGAGSFELLQLCFTKDLNACVGKNRAPLRPGRCVYGAYLNDEGWVIDDAIVYQIGLDNYMTVVNAGMAAAITDHLKILRPRVERPDNRSHRQRGQNRSPGPHVGQSPDESAARP